MFDSETIEVGKIQRGYLTDEQGRRIYFPMFGPARLIPSQDAEAKFRERVFLVGVVLFLAYILGSALNAYWLENLLSPSNAKALRAFLPAALVVICFLC
jgi:hypothetical protein